ncbi:MAG: hypothetical protein QME58_13880 [Bacteroidota bacterium]|nr:hypothetical protein [Bacteroidota bacterium]
MSEQNKYTIGDKEVQLAPPVPNRLQKFLLIAGIEDLTVIGNEARHQEFAIKLLASVTTPEKAGQMMNACLQPHSGFDWDNVDSRIMLTIATDFFSQLKTN